MIDDNDVRSMLIDVRERVIRIEENLKGLPELKQSVNTHTVQIAEAHSSARTAKWLLGTLILSCPGWIYGVLKMLGKA